MRITTIRFFDEVKYHQDFDARRGKKLPAESMTGYRTAAGAAYAYRELE